MTPVLVAAVVASPLPLSDLTASDIATRVAADGALMDRAVRRAHWLVDALLSTPPPRPKSDLVAELTRLLHALDGAQHWWGGTASPDAGAQGDKAFALHCAGRLALLSLLVAGADALHDQPPGDVAASAGRPGLLHDLGPLRKRWRSVRPGLRDRRDDRARGLGWTVPYIERQSRLLAGGRQRAVGRPLPSAPATAARLMGGSTRLAEWPAGSEVPHHDVALTGKDARAMAAKAEPGDVVLASRASYVGLDDGPAAALVLGAWDDLDPFFRGDRPAAKFLGERGVPNRRPRLYMHLRVPEVAAAWKERGGPAAVMAAGAGAVLIPLEDALRADSAQLLRARTTKAAKLRAVALAAHYVGRRVTSEELVRGCYGPGDGMAGVGLAPLPALSEAAAWRLVGSRPARR